MTGQVSHSHISGHILNELRYTRSKESKPSRRKVYAVACVRFCASRLPRRIL